MPELPEVEVVRRGLARTADHPDQTVPSQVAHIARDPVDERFDDDLFLARLARKNTTVKRALLDQRLISGIGKIHRPKQTPLCGAVRNQRACA